MSHTGIWIASKSNQYHSRLLCSSEIGNGIQPDYSKFPHIPLQITSNPLYSILSPVRTKITLRIKPMPECTYCGKPDAAYHGDTSGDTYCDIDCYKLHYDACHITVSKHERETELTSDDVLRLTMEYGEMYGPQSQFSQRPIAEQEHHLQELRVKYEQLRIEMQHVSRSISRNKVKIDEQRVTNNKADDIKSAMPKKQLSALEKAVTSFIKLNFPDENIVRLLTSGAATYTPAEIKVCIANLRK